MRTDSTRSTSSSRSTTRGAPSGGGPRTTSSSPIARPRHSMRWRRRSATSTRRSRSSRNYPTPRRTAGAGSRSSSTRQAGFHYLHRHRGVLRAASPPRAACAGAERSRPPRGVLRTPGAPPGRLRRIRAGERDREPGTRALRAVRQPRVRGTRVRHGAMGAHDARRVRARPPLRGAVAGAPRRQLRADGVHVRTIRRRAHLHDGGALGSRAARGRRSCGDGRGAFRRRHRLVLQRDRRSWSASRNGTGRPRSTTATAAKETAPTVYFRGFAFGFLALGALSYRGCRRGPARPRADRPDGQGGTP